MYDSSSTEADSRNAQVLRPETALEVWDQTSSPGESVRTPVPQVTPVSRGRKNGSEARGDPRECRPLG